MLSLKELRSACAHSFDVKPTFRALIATSILYEKSELGELLFNIDFSFSQFKKIISSNDSPDPEEDRLIIITIKRVKNPTVLDLLLTLCESKLKLKDDLARAGLKVDSLIKSLQNRINIQEKSVMDSVVSADPDSLTYLTNYRMN